MTSQSRSKRPGAAAGASVQAARVPGLLRSRAQERVTAALRAAGVLALPGKAYSQRRRVATLAAAALAVAVGYHVVFGQNGLTAYRQKRQETHALDEQMQRLSEENEALQGHVDRLGSDPASIEHQAREELHYTRPGEVIVTLPPDTKIDDRPPVAR